MSQGTGGRWWVWAAGAAALLLLSGAARAEDPKPAAEAPAVSAPAAVAPDDDPSPADGEAPAAEAAADAPAPKKGPSTGSVTEELTVDKADVTADNPRAGSASNHLAASFNLGEEWALDFSFDFTATQAAAPSGQPFPDQGGKATAFGIGADWDPNDHLSLGAVFNFSPKSTNISGTTLDYQAGSKTTTLDAQLRAVSSSANAGLSFNYDTAGETNLEWTFSLGVTGAQLDTTQVVTDVQLRNGQTINKDTLNSYCTNNPKACPKTLKAALKERAYTLDSAQLSAGAMATLFEDTDLGVTLDRWLYAQDPTEVGYFSLTGQKGFSGGGGVPIAPMKSDVRLDLTHRFGALSVKVNGSLGGYVDGTGGGTYGGGVRVQYKFSKAFRLWLSLAAHHDVDDAGADSVSRSGALGAGLRF